MDELIKLMVNPSAAFQKASEAQGQPATIGLLAQSMFQVVSLSLSLSRPTSDHRFAGTEYVPGSFNWQLKYCASMRENVKILLCRDSNWVFRDV